jgi:hypothetical protein
MRVENKLVENWLNLNLSPTGLSRNRSGSIQITMFVYDILSYFDYDYAWA